MPASRDNKGSGRTEKRRSNSGPGALARGAAALSGLWSGVGVGLALVGRSLVALIIIAGAFAWIFGRGPLERYVASLTPGPLEVRFNWPLTSASEGSARRETWLPAPIQQDLVRIAREQLSADPFDQASLERATAALWSTGWFERINSIRRAPFGEIRVDAEWRTPTAIVSSKGRELLVARNGEVLRLPPGTPVVKGSMPVIMSPHQAPPVEDGDIACGKPWAGGDVQAAIALLRFLQTMPESRRIAGIDLADFGRTGHLVLVTDIGSQIVWGSPPEEVGPGQVSVEKRRGRLKEILSQRLDASQKRIEIYPPVVLVDNTVPSE